MIFVKIYPHKDWLENFLKNKGLDFVEEDPQVLHYFGKTRKDLKNLLKKDKPDLLINHSFRSFDLGGNQIYHPLTKGRFPLFLTAVDTNCYNLCKYYYQKIGLQAEIRTIPSPKIKERAKWEVNFLFGGYFANLKRKFYSFMGW